MLPRPPRACAGETKWAGAYPSVSGSGRRSGSDVRAVAYGRVVFADWFKGYGLMIIIDHGDNYLSLYGYNETLRREVGDWVQPGEIVASSGASGGQHGDSVYFALRQKSSAIDPAPWFKR